MPATAGASENPNFLFDIDTVLPEDRRTFRYSGALTTPPCSEQVQWLLIKAPGTVAPSQAGMFHSIIGYNARYTQPVHGREVLEDSSVD